MITRLKLKPGQKGTKALAEKYGEDFVCVRYRYDEPSRTRIKRLKLLWKESSCRHRQEAIKMKVSWQYRPPAVKINGVKWPDPLAEFGVPV